MSTNESSSYRSGSLGLDLHLELPARPGALRLASALRDAVRKGRLPAGSRVPSTRALATDLGISRGAVTRAHELLAAEGYLVIRQGSPTTVAPGPFHAPEPTDLPATRRGTELRWDLLPGKPDLGTFPRQDWAAAQHRALRAAPAAELDYGNPRGHPALRTALAEYLGRVRGVRTTPEQVVVCEGHHRALHLLSTVLRQRGTRSVDYEDPTLPKLRGIPRAAGLEVRAVPVDAEGIDVTGLESPAAVVTPAHQYPLGSTMSERRRKALCETATSEQRLIIEDDYDGEFRFDREPVGALQRIAPRNVVYAGTASKTLAPGLRLSWLVLPPALVGPVGEVKAHTDSSPAVFDQLTLAEMLRSGSYDQHVRRCRAIYRRRRQQLVSAIRESDTRHELYPAGIAAGLHLTLRLDPDGPSEERMLERMRRHSVALEGLAEHWIDERRRQDGLVIGYAAPPGHAFENSLRALLRGLAQPRNRGAPREA
ncbi:MULTISPECIES: PLP-dependent aminotransferase family protein [Actinopolyspora]|uniref:GntR family transcriptional regulator / MocR family aminotransferase n=1 Tax=Actinopolyspora saharensis TaxID=995062 RepID=A0A1H1GIM0_9ACTN|nr:MULTISPECIES: PLP-dependent aminotransferase family protein [Actinopolyspora]NHD16591.1 PLP-dependent aminotransferase family protein [Actinopolyspora sp. BKK2]NHE75546.1 PLP-dependent aminotransferase family protein [Actinopolyspora sp. BKK1]SDR12987.1 GntR family transcriptional regulator / MocR family aminotransferase [Actinopolyspora saharensis]